MWWHGVTTGCYACCDTTEGGLKAGLGMPLSLGGSAGVDGSILMLIFCPLKVVLLLWNVLFSLRMHSVPLLPHHRLALPLFLYESKDLTHHDQYLVSHA